MKHYNVDIDFAKPIRQKIIVPTGEDYAVKVTSYMNGETTKTIKFNGTLSEYDYGPSLMWLPTTEVFAMLVSQDPISPSIAANFLYQVEAEGLDEYMTLYLAKSDEEKTVTLEFYAQYKQTVDESGHVEQEYFGENDCPRCYVDVQYVKSNVQDGNSWSLDIAGAVDSLDVQTLNTYQFSTDALSASNASVQALSSNTCFRFDDSARTFRIGSNKCANAIEGKRLFAYTNGSGVSTNNGIGSIELTGNFCLNNNFTSDITSRQTARNIFYLDNYSKRVMLKELTVGNETLSVLQVVDVSTLG